MSTLVTSGTRCSAASEAWSHSRLSCVGLRHSVQSTTESGCGPTERVSGRSDFSQTKQLWEKRHIMSEQPSQPQAYDLIVIGSGPAGQKAALAAAKQRFQVAIVDQRQALGGAC